MTLERDEHIAEWVRLTEEKMEQIAPSSDNAKVGAGRGNKGGIRAAVHELGIERTEVRRAINHTEKIADSGVQLDALANATKEQQIAAVQLPHVFRVAVGQEMRCTRIGGIVIYPLSLPLVDKKPATKISRSFWPFYGVIPA